MSHPAPPPQGWYPDPADPSRLRWWDGATWTEHRRDRAVATTAPAGLRPVGDFITGSFRAVVAVIRPLLILAAIAIVPLVVALLLADSQLGLADWLDEVVEVTEQADPGESVDLPRWDVNGASAAIWGVAIGILYLFAFAALPLAAVPLLDDAGGEADTDVDRALRTGLRAVPRALVVALVVALTLLAVLAVLVVITAVVPLLGVLLFLAAVPVVIYGSVRLLLLAQPLLVIEGLGLGLFRRSWELTRGRFWGLFGRSLLFGLIVGFASNVVTFPIQLLGAADPQLATLLGATAGLAAGAASGLVQVAGPVLLYRDLVDGPPAPPVPRLRGPSPG
jgi:hypothetical protein